MNATTYLHWTTGDEGTTRILTLVAGHARIGRGPTCDARIPDPSLGDVHCVLRRRGRRWHLHPVARTDALTIDGERVERATPLELGAIVHVGPHRLTLLSEEDPGVFGEPTGQDRGRRASPPLSDSSARRASLKPTVEPTAGQKGTISKEATLQRHDRWLDDHEQERQWRDRWRAFGQSLQERSKSGGAGRPIRTRRATPSGPRPEPSLNVPKPPTPTAKPEPPWYGSAVAPAPAAFPTPAEPTPSGSRELEGREPRLSAESLARDQSARDTSRSLRVFTSESVERFGAERFGPSPRPERSFDRTEDGGPERSIEPPDLETPGEASAFSEAEASVQVLERPDSDEAPTASGTATPQEPATLETAPEEPGLGARPSLFGVPVFELDGLVDWLTSPVQRPRSTSSEDEPKSNQPAKRRDVTRPTDAAPFEAPAPPDSSRLTAPEPAAETKLSEPTESEGPTLEAKAAIASTKIGQDFEVLITSDEKIDASTYSRSKPSTETTRQDDSVFAPGDPNVHAAARPELKGIEPEAASKPAWPSARRIIDTSRPRASSARPRPRSRAKAKRRSSNIPEPTSCVACEAWTVPGGAILCAPMLVLVVAAGAFGLKLSWTWAVADRDVGRLADRLLGATQPSAKLFRELAESEAELPNAHWWKSDSDQMMIRSIILSEASDGMAPEADRRASELLEAARSASPIHPSLKYAIAWKAARGAGPSSTHETLGLSRDVVSLSLTGSALRDAGKSDEARRAFRRALELACRSRVDPHAAPRFSDDPNIRRFELPLEDLVARVIRRMADQSSWNNHDWISALPDFSLVHLAAGRVLKARGEPTALEAFERAVELSERPAPPGYSAALHEAAGAEALAMLGRWSEAEARYRAALERLASPGDLLGRAWAFNLADLHERLGNREAEREYRMASMVPSPNDPITAKAIELSTRGGLSFVRSDDQ